MNTDLKPGTRVEVTLPFAKRPFMATISEDECPNPTCYRIIVDKPSRATVSVKVANVDKRSCRAV